MRFLARYFGLLATLAAAAASCIFLAADQSARAQIARTIRIVVPYAPGGAADIVARLMADQAGRTGGVTMVVENRPGAGGAVGTETVARATPDGTTLLVVSTPFLIDPLLRKLNYDPLHSFAPICNLVSAPTLIVVNSVSPYRTLAELLDDARARPGQITMASIGPASSFQLGFEMLKRAAKVDMTFVPYPGNAPALSAVLGQQVTSMFATLPNVSEYLKAGKLRALAVGNRTRAEPLPDVPTVAESGYPGYSAVGWGAIFVPNGTPQGVIDKLNATIARIITLPEVKKRFEEQGTEAAASTQAEMAKMLRDDYAQFGESAKRIGVAID